MTWKPKVTSCDEAGVIPSRPNVTVLSLTINGEFDDTSRATVAIGTGKGAKFKFDARIDVQEPTQIEYNKIKVPVVISWQTEAGDRTIRVNQGADAYSKTPIFQVKKGEE